MFVPIANEPRDYAWGSTTAIAEFLGRQPTGRPEAELWLGGHPGSPSRIVAGPTAARGAEPDTANIGATDLAQWIAADPATALGDELAEAERLPFLMKVLAAAAPLSLQAHPTSDRAREGFDRENAAGIPLQAHNRNYRDPFHKPELIVAVGGTLDALCGFRPLSETAALLAELRSLAEARTEQPTAIDLIEARLASATPLRDTVEWLLNGRGDDDVARVVEGIVALSTAAADALPRSPFGLTYSTITDLATAYPGDPGIAIALLLNRVTLNEGEALYLPAGNIHAYLRGLGIELMAASDNVLRGGLTPKHIDVPELLQVLDFTAAPVPRLLPERPRPGVEIFQPDVPDFMLYRVRPDSAQAEASIDLDGPAIALCARGDMTLRGAGPAIRLSRGDAVYVTPDEHPLIASGTGDVFIATTGR